MFWTLLKVKLWSLYDGLISSSKRKRTQTTIISVLMIFLFAYLAIMIASLASVAFTALAIFLKGNYPDMMWLYFTVASLVTFTLCIILGVFNSQTQLFLSKDNDLQLSMPIPPSYILGSRVSLILFINLVISALINIPTTLIYIIVVGFTPVGLIASLLSIILIPLISFSIIALIGWLISIVSSKLRYKNLISIIFSMGFLGIYFYVYINAVSIFESLMQNADSVAKTSKMIFPLYHFGLAGAEGNGLSLLLFILSSVIPFALVYYILSKTFLTIATTKKGHVKVKYVEGREKVKSRGAALVTKELKHLISSTAYFMNTCVGLLMCLGAAVFAAVKRNDIINLLDQIEFSDKIYVIVAIAISYFASMCFITAPSISLEGKKLWIAKSLPIDPFEIIMSKVYMAKIVSAPVIFISSLIIAIAFPIPVISYIPYFLFPQAANFLFQTLGVIINLKFPKFDFINETQVIKQSMSSFISMFGNMIINSVFMVFIIVFSILIDVNIVLTLLTLGIIGLSVLEVLFIKKVGVKMFSEMH